MWSIRKPSREKIEAFLASQKARPFSYAEVGVSRGAMPCGYDHDQNRIRLGGGEAVFASACRALDQWRMFPAGWTEIHPASPPQQGATVAMLARVLCVWWLNACRIVYLVEEQEPVRRHGFAYGTLEQHVEKGEECFVIEMDAEGSVWYDLRAFSRPRYWMARIGYPLARKMQRRFVRESQQAMLRAVEGSGQP